MSYDPQAASRGALVADYLTGRTPAGDYASRVASDGTRYNGFNLIVGNLDSAYYVANRREVHEAVLLDAGRYVLSNHLLNTAWPKTQRLKERLDDFPLERLARSLNPVFEILKDQTIAEDRKSTRLNSSHVKISYAVFCLKKKKKKEDEDPKRNTTHE